MIEQSTETGLLYSKGNALTHNKLTTLLKRKWLVEALALIILSFTDVRKK